MVNIPKYSVFVINTSLALNKANQDSYVVCENFMDNNCHYFGGFDGHGEYGDYCSHFAADQVS